MGELLLELLCEEIPARMQRRAIEDLKRHLNEWLQVHRIQPSSVTGYVTPRRMAIIAEGIPEHEPTWSEEARGPRLGSPPQAVQGFLRSVGLSSIEQCEVRKTNRGEFYFATVMRGGRATKHILPDLIYSTFHGVEWPKSMRYPTSELRWVRPLISVICLLDGEVIKLPLGHVPVGRITRGHRFLSPSEIAVANAADYRDKLAKACVVLDHDERRAIIAKDLDALASAEGLTVKPDEGLLDEVTGLVECPIVLMGAIDADFVRPLPDGLPPEVLATAMRTHQKYFSCLKPDGTPATCFLFVANNIAPDGGKTIIAGNERVLRARLADARFFWDQDRRVPLASRVEALSKRVFHAKLGSLHDKVVRMDDLADYFIPIVKANEDFAKRAIFLAKADLSTNMVGEFPELQGVIGRYYALHDGENSWVANAITEHYKPAGPDDSCPTAPESVVVALADKIDTLAGFFAIRETPTGSRDPFALRRAALGIIRLILENELRISLRECLSRAAHPFRSFRNEAETAEQLFNFVADRLHIHLRSQGFGYDVISAIFERGAEDDLVRLVGRVRALQRFLASDDGASLLTAYRRASNIVAIEERKDGRAYDGDTGTALLLQLEERELAAVLAEVGERAGTFLECEQFEKAMSELARLRRPVDDFFDKVTVNSDDPALRENRLRLLSRIRATLNRVADFSQIEG